MKISKSELKKMILEVLGDEPEESPTKQHVDVKKTGQKMDKIAGLDNLLAKINNRGELEQLLIQILGKTNVKPADVITGFVKAAKSAVKKVKGK